TLHSVDVSAEFVNERPAGIEAKYVTRTPRDWSGAQKDAYELELKLMELESKANMQTEVMSDRAEEKQEATRLLSLSFEHYMSGYK
ncbi:photosystem II reaction center PSB28 protein, chloroplastic, partial [Tanacetum coccineum]